MMKATWELDYDFRTDKCFKRPSCPECSKQHGCVPVLYLNDAYRCLNCHREVEVDDKQKKWIDKRSETKTKMEDCMPDKEIEIDGKKIKLGCGGKNCVEVHYGRNEVTLKWQVRGSVCRKCGRRSIV